METRARTGKLITDVKSEPRCVSETIKNSVKEKFDLFSSLVQWTDLKFQGIYSSNLMKRLIILHQNFQN